MTRKLKDSGIEWVGEIPVNWNINTAFQIFSPVKSKNIGMQENNLLSLSYGRIIKKDINSSFGLLPESFEGYNIIEPDDIVLRLTDLQNDHTSLRVGLSEQRGIITSAYLTLRAIIDCSPRYLYYQLHSFDICKGLYGMGAGVRQGLNWEGIKALKMVVPDIDEQERIVEFLDHQCAEIDAVIAKTKATIEEYKKLKQSIITNAVTKGIRGNDRPMKDSGIEWIGDIPADWKVLKMKHLGKCRNGLTYSPENLVSEEGMLVLRSSNIQDGKLVFGDNVYVNCEIREELMVKSGDILICSRNGSRALIGKNALIPEGLLASFGAFMMIFRCNSPRYVQMILNSAVFSYYLGTFLTSTINQLTADNFNNMQIVYCEDETEQEEITRYLEKKCAEIDTLIEKKTALLAEMETYKKSVIYEYVTGKKEV